MKYFFSVLVVLSLFVVPGYARAEGDGALHDIAAPKVKSFFASFDAWRQKTGEHFKELKEKNEASLHEQDLAKQKQLDSINELNPDSLPHTNYLGKGDNEYLSRPMTLARVQLFTFLAFLFLNALIFYLSIILVTFLIVRYFWIHFF